MIYLLEQGKMSLFLRYRNRISRGILESVESLYGLRMWNTVEPPKTDSPYYGNLHNADKSLRSRIIPYTIVYVHKETSVLRTPPK